VPVYETAEHHEGPGDPKGNKLFSLKKYDEAIGKFTKAISLDALITRTPFSMPIVRHRIGLCRGFVGRCFIIASINLELRVSRCE